MVSRLGCAHDRALRNDARGHKLPQPDEQLARQRHDHYAPVATAGGLGSLVKPTARHASMPSWLTRATL